MIATALLLSMIGIADLVRALVRDSAAAAPRANFRRIGGPLRLPMMAWVAATWAIVLTTFIWFLGLAGMHDQQGECSGGFSTVAGGGGPCGNDRLPGRRNRHASGHNPGHRMVDD